MYFGFYDLTNWDLTITNKPRNRQTGLTSCGSFTGYGDMIGEKCFKIRETKVKASTPQISHIRSHTLTLKVPQK